MLIFFSSIIAILCVWQWNRVFVLSDLAFDSQVERQLASIAMSRTQRVNDFFRERIQDANILAQSSEIKNLLEGRLSQNNDIIASNLRKKQEILAKQLGIYIRKYPRKTWNDFEKDEEFRALAVQTVGFSGNTYLIDESDKTVILDSFRSGAFRNELEFLTLEPTSLGVKTFDGKEPVLVTRWRSIDFKMLEKPDIENTEYLDIFSRSGGYRNIFLVSRDGDISRAIQPSLDLGENLGFESQGDSYLKEAYELAKNSKRIEIVGPYIDVDTSDSMKAILYVAPVYEEENFLGMVILQTDMSEIENIMKENSGLGNTGEAYLIDQRGFLITPLRHRDITLLAQKIITDNAKHCLEQIQRGNTTNQSNIAHFSDYKGDESIGTYGLIGAPKWCSIAEITAREVFDLPKNGKKSADAVAVGTVAMLVIFIFGFASRRWNKDSVILSREKYCSSFEKFPFKYVLFGGLLVLTIITLALHFVTMK